MFSLKKKVIRHKQADSFGAGVLEQNFSQLSADTKALLKDYIKTLLAMQNKMTKTIPLNDTTSVKKEGT